MPVTGAQLLAAALESGPDTSLRAATSCASVDGLLGGGFAYGKVTSLAGEAGTGKTTIAMHAAARHAVQDREATVAVVDTRGSFSLVALRDIVQHHLSRAESGGGASGVGLGDCLARIEIMRCFDFAGLVEAVEEAGTRYAEIWGTCDSQHPGRRMLIVDDMTNVMDQDPVRDDAESAALFASFHQSLCRLTRRNQICSLLLNTTIATDAAGRGAADHAETRASSFLSMKQKPAHGNHYAHMIDLSILLFRLPRGREDAEARYAADPGRYPPWASATIFEIFLDHDDARDGQWCAFEADGIELRAMEGPNSSA